MTEKEATKKDKTSEATQSAPQQVTPEAAPATKEAKAPAVKFANVVPGVTVRVHQKIKEEAKSAKGKEGVMKERIQVFEGIVLARRGKRPEQSTITVRKVSDGIGVEKIFPLALPTIAKIDVVKQARVRRAKLYYLRSYGKKLRERIISQ
jgi:large subunit ribosomal protein L19